MSVINKMLKDLDKRQQPHGIETMAQSQIVAPANVASKKPILFASGLSLLAGGLVVFIALNYIEFSNGADPANVIVAQQPQQAVVPVAEELQAEQQSQPKPQRHEPVIAEDSQQPDLPQPSIVSRAQQSTPTNGNEVTQQAANVSAVIEPEAKPSNEVASQVSTSSLAAKTDVAVKQVATTAVAPEKQTTLNREVAAVEPQMTISRKVDRSSELHKSSNMAVKEVKLTADQLAQKQMLLASDAQQQGLHSDALTYYLAALEYKPSEHQARRQAAALYYGQNKLPQAAQLLEQGRLLFPQQYEFSLLLARVLQASGQTQQALLSLNTIPDSSDFAVEKWHQQSDLAQKQQDYPVAEKSYRQLAQHEPTQGRWWMGLGYALDAQQKYSDAKQAYQQALLQDNLSAQAKVYIDNRLLQLGAY
ncbi:tetratricopeptide repeat protein [Shewanella fidelis]|uniref:Tetratricopeptide repeat protein n=1 Tax=Shewanella fidelis TaxID=173509 RepID=A0AAW8NJR9_9GAMM|nr:tetratricopeptide repeat protein [Shewanella fidelis]MDR8522153.1 tetratricopeptide repeat protein [Shewanella fidelis]MDW4812632.1 tetratricopeptide repeat protein [Shewanella fidelis]MDW4816380.1 tetratricopeptide repeat protein [Shewanella fidelis]MDW4820873.1 tetratricopeptide repeat protein [Shewanella fidelis]MDW4825096.1 tetratricopeptide repeat protein [Shewanella fidelis]